MGVVYNPDRNTLIPISTVSGEITYLTAGLIYEKMQSCLIIGTEVTYLKHYPDQDLYIADNSYMGIGSYTCIFSNRAQRDPYSYFHRWNPNTQEFVIRGGVSLNLSNATKNGIMYFYFPNNNAYTILSYDYNRLFFNNVEEIKATIKVNYYLPDYDYTYAKITYKQDSEPASETDGTSVNILKDETSVNIEGLEEEKTYYFKIFTDKSESEAFPYTVGEIPGPVIPPDLQPYVDLLASYGVGTNQTSSLTNCQDYSGNSNTVSMEGYSVCIDGNFNVNGNQYFMYVLSNCDIRVTNNSGSISVEYSCTMAPYDTIRTWGRSMWGEYSHSGNRIEYLALGAWTPAVPLDFYQPYNVDNIGITFTTSFNSMVDCMNYLTQHFRRCNLYVDGEQWLNVN